MKVVKDKIEEISVEKVDEKFLDLHTKIGNYIAEGIIVHNSYPHKKSISTGIYMPSIVRENVEICASIDSVPAYSPVIVKDDKGEIDIIPISELTDAYVSRGSDKQVGMSKYKLFMGSVSKASGEFVPINFVLRHRYYGRLIRVNTHGGLVDTSPNHSLIISNGRLIDARKVKIGDRLVMPPLCKQTGLSCKSSPFFFGNEELAWLYGFFAAEGSAYKRTHGKSNIISYEIAISNTNKNHIIRSKRIMEMFLTPKCRISAGDTGHKRIWHITMGNRKCYELFRKNFYTSLGEKRVPKSILNSPENIRKAFLRGYFDGDGSHIKGCTCEFHACSTISQTLAMGIIWLIKSVTGDEYRVYTRDDKLNAIELRFHRKKSFGKDKSVVKKVSRIDYNGWLYDISVDSRTHSFCTGIGPIRVHNTSGSIGEEELREFMSELVGIAMSFNNIKITVIVCDCNVYDTFEITNGDVSDIKLKGGGGTSHKPVYKWVRENKPHCKLLVNFTDGYTDFPSNESVKTLWILSKNSADENTIPFGEVIKL